MELRKRWSEECIKCSHHKSISLSTWQKECTYAFAHV